MVKKKTDSFIKKDYGALQDAILNALADYIALYPNRFLKSLSSDYGFEKLKMATTKLDVRQNEEMSGSKFTTDESADVAIIKIEVPNGEEDELKFKLIVKRIP